MHASILDLLSLRDAAPVDARIAQHVNACEHCARELANLSSARERMQRLPQLDAPSGAWSEIQKRLLLPPTRTSRTKWLSAAGVLAAAVVAISVLTLQTQAPMVASHPPDAAPTVRGEGVAALVERSQELERVLQALPQRRRIERVSTVATIDAIEERIQWLDFQLSYAPDDSLDAAQAQRLWRERVELMDSLVKVRYAEAGRATF